jgi:O-antigen/teichoic acid export membrane protein
LLPTRRRPLPALPLLIGATAIAGLAGYAVTWLVFRGIGPASYATFAVFWSALYLVVGGLSGLQQEFTRATSPRVADAPPATPHRARATPFAVVASLVVGAGVGISALAWAPLVFTEGAVGLVAALAVGVASYALVAVISGSLYGVSRWGTLAVLIATDAVLRLVLVGVGLLLHATVLTLAWLVVLPFALTLLIWAPLLLRNLRGRSALDVGYRQLVKNSGGTITAAVATAVLVSGFPLLLGIAGTGVEPAVLGSLVFAITLTRAPLVITLMALQSYLVVVFRSAGAALGRRLRLILAIVVAAGLLLGVAVTLAGVPVLDLVAGRSLGVDAVFLVLLVVSSVLIAVLSITGSLVLAEDRHILYTCGWGAAALVTLITLLAPGEFVVRLDWSLITGPAVGIAVHLGVRRALASPGATAG